MRMRLLAAVIPAAAVALALSACTAAAGGGTADPKGVISAIGAENQYGDVIGQVGGAYVTVTSIMSNPNTDPHTFEASAQVAQEINGAQLVVQNGVGYDGFMNSLESTAGGGHKIIDVQQLLGLPDSTPNTHLWYKPGTKQGVANAVATDLGDLQPSHATYFKARAASFIAELHAWTAAMDAFKGKYPDTPVATTEPVADYMLQAVGADNLTPWALQADIMNGTDPSAQDVAAQQALFTQHKVKVFLYNQQVTDSLTESFIQLAKQNNIPVVGVYETMPTPGYDYQSWMVAEVQALTKAVADGTSTEHL